MDEDPRTHISTMAETPELAVAPPDSEGPAYEARKAARKRGLFGPDTQMPRIGRYVVLERIGAGGMGEVFSAYDDELDRKVAIKVVHADISEESSQAGSRLLREAQTLAKLSHRNVVHVYEVGTIEGRVFLAMEFIRGQTLRVWLTHNRPWNEVLDTFLEVGRGIAAVHEAGLVHRDVKPDNMLVGDDGRICVADFGLARAAAALTDPSLDRVDMEAAVASIPEIEADAPSRLTASGAIVGTPAYMAPEQLRTQIVDARCDQFSFCVSLWEALAGRRPYQGRSLPDIVEAYRNSPVVPPSPTRVPAKVWRALQRGLAIDPIERWPAMVDLLEELGGAQARPKGKVPALLGVGGVAFALGAIVFASEAPGPCEGLDTTLDGVWDDAARQRLSAGLGQSGASFSTPTFESVASRLDDVAAGLVSERTAACEATHVQRTQSEEMLDRRVACLDRVAGRVRGLVDALASADASMVLRAPDAAAALPDPSMCGPASLQTGLTPPASAQQRDEVDAIRASLDDAATLIDLGQSRRASPRVAALAVDAGRVGYTPLVAEARMVEGSAARDLGQLDEARDSWLEAADLAEGSRHDTVAASAWSALARLAWTDLDDAEVGQRWLRRARAATTRLGRTASSEADLLRTEGELLRLGGDIPAARAKLEASLQALGASPDPDRPQTWRTLLSLASLMEASGDARGALGLYRDYATRIEARLGPDHPMVASAAYNIGKLLVATGDYDGARTQLERSVAVWRAAYGETHPDLAYSHVALEEVELTVGSLERARTHAEEALRIREATLPSDHPDLGLALLGVGAVALMQGDAKRAVGAYEASVAIHERSLGPKHPQTAIVRANLGEALLATGDGPGALQAATKALADLSARDGMDPVVLAFARRIVGGALRLTGDLPAAVVELQEAKALLADHTGDPLERGLLHFELARALGDDPAAPAEVARAKELLGSAGSDAAKGYLAQVRAEFPDSAPRAAPR
jgi:tRNA A-37 threonylcarbamoyl transferase component Bud32/tetratricopeptide (TPR) repeat protein